MRRKNNKATTAKNPVIPNPAPTPDETLPADTPVLSAPSEKLPSQRIKSDNKQYWQQAGSFVLGAMIAAVSSGLVTYMQGKAQMKQLRIDRQLSTLKEYSTIFNQGSSLFLSKARGTIQRLEFFLLKGLENVPDKDEQEVFKMSEEMFNESYTFRANLITQRTMVYATFGMKTPPIAYLDSASDDEAIRFKEKLYDFVNRGKAAKSEREQAQILREVVTMLHDFLSNAEKEIIETTNQENEDIRLLAEGIQKEY